ncbi:MAG: hypothetical protein MJ252_25495 [archaeon]|nr:hypothetical protein [archaeon]
MKKDLYESYKKDLEASKVQMSDAIKRIEEWVKGCEDAMYLKLKGEYEKQVKYLFNI